MLKPIHFSPPDITEAEIAEVAEALRSGWITTGPRTKEFERRITAETGALGTVCLNSATAAMELSLRVLGVGRGDEVITTAYTYTASASVIDHVGATIRMVDTNEDDFEMDLEQLAATINENTKAIIPVDIAGLPCNYEALYEVIESKRSLYKANPDSEYQKALGRIAIVADAAHSFGAYDGDVMTGNLADFNCFSFHAVKNLTTAEGGAVTWSDKLPFNTDNLYQEFQLQSLHGQSKDARAKMQPGAWEYDIVSPAYKSNMTDMAASLGLIQLDRYPDLLKRRREIVAKYDEAFVAQGWKPLMHHQDSRVSSYHLYLLQIPGFNEERRNALILKLAEEQIAANVHYKPLPMMTAYRKLGFDISDYPNAYANYEKVLSLPLHTLLSDEDVERIIEAMIRLVPEV